MKKGMIALVVLILVMAALQEVQAQLSDVRYSEN